MHLSKYWQIDEKRFVYSAIAYPIGLIVGSILVVLLAFCKMSFFGLGVVLPIFVGSLFAGFVVRQKGWLMALFLTMLIVIARYLATYVLTPLMSGPSAGPVLLSVP